MGCNINQSSISNEHLAHLQASERAYIERVEREQQHYATLRAEEDRVIKERNQPPPGVDPNYYNDLWKLTAPAATNEGNVPHPELPGATSAQLHASQGLELKEREWAAQQNAMQEPGSIAEYHPEAPVVVYNTNAETRDVNRVHGPDNALGRYATRGEDIRHGHISPAEAQDLLDLSYLPSHVSDVAIRVGTQIEASRPVSGQVRQIKVSALDAVNISNTRKLG